MPLSRAARTQACAASSSTWLPCVSQLPYAISEMVRPERPSRLYSTCADRSPPRRAASPGSDVGAHPDLGLREAPAPDHGRAAHAVPDRTLRALIGQPVGQGALDLAA